MMPTRPRRGYVLAAVLVSLLVATLTLAILARSSLQLAGEALVRERQLQARWGAISCQKTLLPLAAPLFNAMDGRESVDTVRSRGRWPRIDRVIELGGLQFKLTLADEDAKVNLNSLYHFQGRAHVQRYVTQQVRGSRTLDVRLLPMCRRVDPRAAIEADEALPPAFQSWGQVFDLSRARPLAAGRLAPRQWTGSMTCWGQGRLNVRRAPDEAVVSVCRLTISDGVTRRLLRKYRENRHDIARVAEQVGIDAEDRVVLEQLLTDQSACYSLWMTVSGRDFVEQRHVIAERDEEGVLRTSVQLY